METSHLRAQYALWQKCIISNDNTNIFDTNVMGLLTNVCYKSLTGNPPLLVTLTGVRKPTTNYALFCSKTSIIPDLPSDLDKLNWKQTHTERGLLTRRLVAKSELQKVLLANFEN